VERTRRRQVAYAALAAADTWLAGTGRRGARRLTKPLLMPALAAVTVSRSAPHPPVYAALAGSWVGDLALLRSEPEAFVAGAGAFAVGHAGWLGVLAPQVGPGGWTRGPGRAVAGTGLILGPVVAVAAGREHRPLGGVLAAYAGVLTAVGVAALGLDPGLPPATRRTAAAGALLFLASDGLLGLTRFVLDTDDARWEAAVMATYAAAQGLLEEAAARL
jgi:uncharacterized membrane protein YhhN